MDDKQKRDMADALREAMRSEIEGRHFYRMAAETTADPKGRKVFAELAEDELAHYEALKKQFEALTGGAEAVPKIALPAGPDLSGPSPIFSEQIKGRMHQAHFEMTSLSVGIQLELKAQKFYRRQAEAAEDQAVADLFSSLAEWEAGHYEALLRQQESLKEDYWGVMGFAPY